MWAQATVHYIYLVHLLCHSPRSLFYNFQNAFHLPFPLWDKWTQGDGPPCLFMVSMSLDDCVSVGFSNFQFPNLAAASLLLDACACCLWFLSSWAHFRKAFYFTSPLNCSGGADQWLPLCSTQWSITRPSFTLSAGFDIIVPIFISRYQSLQVSFYRAGTFQSLSMFLFFSSSYWLLNITVPLGLAFILFIVSRYICNLGDFIKFHGIKYYIYSADF